MSFRTWNNRATDPCPPLLDSCRAFENRFSKERGVARITERRNLSERGERERTEARRDRGRRNGGTEERLQAEGRRREGGRDGWRNWERGKREEHSPDE